MMQSGVHYRGASLVARMPAPRDGGIAVINAAFALIDVP